MQIIDGSIWERRRRANRAFIRHFHVAIFMQRQRLQIDRVEDLICPCQECVFDRHLCPRALTRIAIRSLAEDFAECSIRGQWAIVVVSVSYALPKLCIKRRRLLFALWRKVVFRTLVRNIGVIGNAVQPREVAISPVNYTSTAQFLSAKVRGILGYASYALTNQIIIYNGVHP
jgi:hypothetical protein